MKTCRYLFRLFAGEKEAGKLSHAANNVRLSLGGGGGNNYENAILIILLKCQRMDKVEMEKVRVHSLKFSSFFYL